MAIKVKRSRDGSDVSVVGTEIAALREGNRGRQSTGTGRKRTAQLHAWQSMCEARSLLEAGKMGTWV
eukprot:6107340-Pleurochrysis_carterae.AAC.2